MPTSTAAYIDRKILSEEALELIEHNAEIVLKEIGIEFKDFPLALELFKEAGADIAAYTDLSRRQLQRLFQRYLTCTPSRYYLQIRLARARELLNQTSMSLVEISTLTGFVSSSHFNESYKAVFGRSPSAAASTSSFQLDGNS